MRTTKYLLIGGGLASSRAADQIRKRDPDGSITLVTDEPHAPYDRPPLSKDFLRGERSAEDLLYHPAVKLAEEHIDLLLETSVEALDLEESTARISGGQEIRFEKVLIGTGGRPVRLGLPGEDLDGVHYLRTLSDVEAIRRDAEGATRAVIVGAGFIGLEAAASLTQKGLHVTVIEAEQRIWPRFADASLAEFFHRYSTERGVTFHTGEFVTAIGGDGRASAVTTRSGLECRADLVLMAVGIVPNVEIAERAGLSIDDGIVVDSRMQASHENVWAAGDVVNYPDPVFDTRRRVEHWGHAEHSGQVAGINMAGGDQEYGLLGYVWSDVFDLHLEFAGDEGPRDRIVVRGTMGEPPFTVLYLKDDRLTAYFSVNGPSKEFGQLQKLIRRRVDLSGKEAQLTDPSTSLRDLI